MRRRPAGTPLVAAALLVFAATGAASSPPGVRFRSLAEGTEEARKTGKPALYFFTADCCGPRHDRKKNVFGVPIEVVDRRREDGANSADVEALRVRMGVTGFPTLAIQRVDGNAAVRLVGKKWYPQRDSNPRSPP